jgi:hypothetical protein
MTDEERFEELRDVLGMSADQARFVIAMEKGELTGDVIEVDPTPIEQPDK